MTSRAELPVVSAIPSVDARALLAAPVAGDGLNPEPRVEMVSMTRRRRSADRRTSAAELMSQLQQNPEFAAGQARQEAERQTNIERYRLAARGVLADLAAIGFQLEAVGDLRLLGTEYPRAVPVLTRWLPNVQYQPLKEDIVRTLSVPWAREALPVLLSEFERAEDPTGTGLRWAIANAIEVLADEAVFEPVASLARNRGYGRARQMLVLALAKMAGAKPAGLLVELLQDDDVSGHALQALAVLRAGAPAPLVRPFLEHRQAWVRKAAKKVLANSSV